MIKYLFGRLYLFFIKFRIIYLQKRSKRLSQQNRVNLYKEFSPFQGDVGIGYKNGMLYDYLYKEYII